MTRILATERVGVPVSDSHVPSFGFARGGPTSLKGSNHEKLDGTVADFGLRPAFGPE